MFSCDSHGFFMKAAVISLLAIAFCFSCSSKRKETETPAAGELDLLSLASVQIPGWQEEETILMSKAEDVSKYMDSEAGLCFAYGLKRLAVKKFRHKESHPMLVEIYEFDNSENAYGMYSFDTVGEKLDIGQDAVYGHGLLKFWKGKILVKVLAEEEYEKLEEDILAFGRQVNSRILTTGSKPRLLSLVPEEDLVPDSLHFFHENICLNNIHYMPESTALSLSEQTDVATAQYALEGKPPPWRLLMIQYPDESAARTAFENFGALYFQEQPISAEQRINIVEMAEKEYDSITLNRNYVILVLGARHPDLCKKSVAATLTRIELYGRREVY